MTPMVDQTTTSGTTQIRNCLLIPLADFSQRLLQLFSKKKTFLSICYKKDEIDFSLGETQNQIIRVLAVYHIEMRGRI